MRAALTIPFALAITLSSALLPVTSRARAQAATTAFAEGASARASEDDVRLRLDGGGSFAYGNARSLGVHAAAAFTMREGDAQLALEASYLHGLAQVPLTCAADPMGVGCGGAAGPTRTGGFADWTENTNNLLWRARVDHFLSADDAIFAAHRGRRDPFAGLDARLGVQLGYSRVLFHETFHRLALDLGVDATADLYTGPVVAQLRAAPPSFPPLQGTDGRLVPSIRALVAYSNRTNAALRYETSLEVLWNVVNPAHVRLDWQNQIRSTLAAGLSLGFDVTVRFDAAPPGQATPWQENAQVRGADGVLRAGQVTSMLDVVTTLNLVADLDLDGAPAAAPEAPACAPCPPCTACPSCAPPPPVPPPG